MVVMVVIVESVMVVSMMMVVIVETTCLSKRLLHRVLLSSESLFITRHFTLILTLTIRVIPIN